MKLSAAYISLAYRLQESIGDLSAPAARQSLVKALMDEGAFPLVREAGARHSSSDMQLLQTIHDHAVGLGATCAEPDADDLTERFVSKGERDSMDSSDFAGKGKSFPVKTQADVEAALHSIGRAGPENYSSAELHANIIRIAKRKGLSVPDSSKESQVVASGPLKLTESAATVETIQLREARADYEIKLIAPGKGSSAFYPAEVLKRDGPKVFGAGTHVYLNHPTAAEESARPEGDVSNLAGVLSTAAQYHESHSKGAGLYARMKVFADHAQMVEEKAPHVGMSIRASGVAESGKVRDGVPVLKELTRAESVDVVTRAGAGGMILTEAARPQEADMDVTEVQRLVAEGVAKALREVEAKNAAKQSLLESARAEGVRLLEGITLPPAAREEALSKVLARELPLTEGTLDKATFKDLIEAAAKREGEYLTKLMGNGAQPRGLGASGPLVVIDAKEAEAHAKQAKEEQQAREADALAVFESLGMPKEAAAIAARGRVA